MNWQVGQRFTMTSMNYAGHDLEFKILGVLPDMRWSQNFFFRDDYFQEGTGDKDRFHMMWVRVRDPETGQRVAAQIERTFESSDTEAFGRNRIGRHRPLDRSNEKHRGHRRYRRVGFAD